MRVTINTTEIKLVRGIFKKIPGWEVTCKIEFTSDELTTIKKRNLSDMHIYDREFGSDISDPLPRELRHVIKDGIVNVFLTPVAAQNFEHELSEKLLPTLKNYLTASAQNPTGPKVLEF
jgi:hypothetical protein